MHWHLLWINKLTLKSYISFCWYKKTHKIMSPPTYKISAIAEKLAPMNFKDSTVMNWVTELTILFLIPKSNFVEIFTFLIRSPFLSSVLISLIPSDLRWPWPLRDPWPSIFVNWEGLFTKRSKNIVSNKRHVDWIFYVFLKINLYQYQITIDINV